MCVLFYYFQKDIRVLLIFSCQSKIYTITCIQIFFLSIRLRDNLKNIIYHLCHETPFSLIYHPSLPIIYVCVNVIVFVCLNILFSHNYIAICIKCKMYMVIMYTYTDFYSLITYFVFLSAKSGFFQDS